MEWDYLVSLDIGGIHEYVFGTGKLREVRGASILLDKLNTKEAVNSLAAFGSEGVDWRCLVAGGGNVKVLFADGKKAESYRTALGRKFEQEAPGARVTITVSRKEAAWSEKEWMDQAEAALNREKQFNKYGSYLLTSSYFKTCQACGLRPAEETDPKEARYICTVCHAKINQALVQDMRIYKQIFNELAFVTDAGLPNDFSEIGEVSKPQGYIGFIYADGNGMGEKLRGIGDFQKLSDFSADVDRSTLEAAIEAIKNNFDASNHCFQIILAGGDDLIMAVPADKALQLAMDFCADFNRRMQRHDLTMSASIVICHDSMPIKNILDVAEALLKKAKSESRRSNESYIDFIALSNSSTEDVIACRKKELEYDGNVLTMRPYALADCEALVNTIKSLKKSDFPKNKVKALYTALFKGYNVAHLEGHLMITRLAERQISVIDKMNADFRIDKFPWHSAADGKFKTPWGDITELYDFIREV